MSLVLNQKFREWYLAELSAFIEENDVRQNPDLLKDFVFDLNEAKIDVCKITDDMAITIGCKSHLQTTADMLCIGRKTVHRKTKEVY